ncbi:outer envelope pore protein 16-4, chloroplastic isoform X2 [Malus domestica]|uniref:outer envelope pore protein 16-4, chloroplastic isoform X2 n=1 Tax=Malus domestica TaxID=3750 RepID=UPI0039767570
MEGEPCDVVPCSSVTVDSILRIGTAGAIWGLCAGPHDARKKGLAGSAQVAFVARSAGTFGVQYGKAHMYHLCSLFLFCFVLFFCLLCSERHWVEGLVAGICTLTHCGLQRYRGKSDWVSEWCGCWCSSRGSYCRYDTKLDAGDSYGLSGFCLQSCH